MSTGECSSPTKYEQLAVIRLLSWAISDNSLRIQDGGAPTQKSEHVVGTYIYIYVPSAPTTAVPIRPSLSYDIAANVLP